jgi:hypothetical protein
MPRLGEPITQLTIRNILQANAVTIVTMILAAGAFLGIRLAISHLV